MDLENFSRSDIKRHLAELGYSNITEEKLDSFVRYISFSFGFMSVTEPWLLRDLRKLIKYEERKKEVENKLDDIDKQPPERRKVRNLSLETHKLLSNSSFFPGAWHIHLSGTGGKAAAKNSKEREEERWEWGHDDEE